MERSGRHDIFKIIHILQFFNVLYLGIEKQNNFELKMWFIQGQLFLSGSSPIQIYGILWYCLKFLDILSVGFPGNPNNGIPYPYSSHTTPTSSSLKIWEWYGNSMSPAYHYWGVPGITLDIRIVQKTSSLSMVPTFPFTTPFNIQNATETEGGSMSWLDPPKTHLKHWNSGSIWMFGEWYLANYHENDILLLVSSSRVVSIERLQDTRRQLRIFWRKAEKKKRCNLMSLKTTSRTAQTISGIKLSFPVVIDVFFSCESLFFRVGERLMYISYKAYLEISYVGIMCMMCIPKVKGILHMHIHWSYWNVDCCLTTHSDFLLKYNVW